MTKIVEKNEFLDNFFWNFERVKAKETAQKCFSGQNFHLNGVKKHFWMEKTTANDVGEQIWRLKTTSEWKKINSNDVVEQI